MRPLIRDITPAQIIVPLIVGAVVFVLVSLASYVPPLPEWTIAKSKRDLGEDTHITAAATLDALQPRSFTENVEFCGYLYRGPDGIKASVPTTGDRSSCPIDYDGRADADVVATYHSHAGYDTEFDNEAPSINDLRITIDEGVDDFIATPGGRLWYLSAEFKAAMLICDQGCLQTDRKFKPCPADESAQSYHLDDLIARDERPMIFC